ncbi:MAG: hypothetical protein Q7T89_05265, partial [Anaerolineales bacterium]|nr:hypothetical protein [Anaerolineales bacterium]
MVRKTTTKTTSATKAKPRRTAAVKAKPTVTESAPTPSVKKGQPIFRAGTWVAILLLIALIEFTIYFNREKEKAVTAEVTPVSESTTIFNAQDGYVSSIEIKPADGEVVKVARNA